MGFYKFAEDLSFCYKIAIWHYTWEWICKLQQYLVSKVFRTMIKCSSETLMEELSEEKKHTAGHTWLTLVHGTFRQCATWRKSICGRIQTFNQDFIPRIFFDAFLFMYTKPLLYLHRGLPLDKSRLYQTGHLYSTKYFWIRWDFDHQHCVRKYSHYHKETEKC